MLNIAYNRSKSLRVAVRLKETLRMLGLSVKEFNPDQPRVPAGEVDAGQWVSVGDNTTRQDSDYKPFSLAARASQARCDKQYESDLFQCRLVSSASCYRQAMERLVACQQGRPIPPLNY